MVPIVENNTVTSVLQVPRNGQRAYYTNYNSHLEFFRNLIFSTYKKVLSSEKSSGATAKGMSCTRTFYSVWMPNNEGNYNPGGGDGHWNTYSVIKCRQMMDECIGTVNEYGECSGGGGGGGYPYPGGGGGENPEPEIPDPCKKTKTVLQKPEVQAKVQTLKEKANANGNEFGFKIKSDGTTSPLIQGGKDKLDFGDMNGYSGFYHVHPGIIGINIFSPPDIQSLFTAIITAGNSSTVSDIYFGVIGSEICQSCPGGIKYFHYLISYNGPIQDAGTISSASYNMTMMRKWYQDQEANLTDQSAYTDNSGTSLNHTGLEKLFFDTLGKMNINKDNMILQKIEDNGGINTISINSDGTTVQIPCP